jgi:hypothetical protein
MKQKKERPAQGWRGALDRMVAQPFNRGVWRRPGPQERTTKLQDKRAKISPQEQQCLTLNSRARNRISHHSRIVFASDAFPTECRPANPRCTATPAVHHPMPGPPTMWRRAHGSMISGHGEGSGNGFLHGMVTAASYAMPSWVPRVRRGLITSRPSKQHRIERSTRPICAPSVLRATTEGTGKRG